MLIEVDGAGHSVYPVERADVVRAQSILGEGPFSARDALHVAVMRRHDVVCILTFDVGFDAIGDLIRLAKP